MSPTPSTPAPRRFLLPSSKRTPASAPSAQAKQSQFHSTPKFAGVSSTPWSHRKATQDIEEVVDEDDHAEGSTFSFGEDEDAEAIGGLGRGAAKDDIEADSETNSIEGSQGDMKHGHESDAVFDQGDKDEGSTPYDPAVDTDIHHALQSPNERVYKRRKVSLSPDIQSESLPSDSGRRDEHHLNGYDGGPATTQNDQEASPPSFLMGDEEDSNDNDERVEQEKLAPKYAQTSRAPTQPTFLSAPRFRAPSPSSLPADVLPTAFSPKRRGQQYIAGGMAAALQTQLSEIKSWDGESATPDEWGLQVADVRAGKRMYLIRGTGTAGEARQDGQRVILAGEGTLTGLGRRAEVSAGGRVRVRQPVWEAVIEGETWVVACDWNVLG